MQEQELIFLPGYVIRDKILNKEVSCQEVTQTFLSRIERLNPKLNAYILILKEQALKQAQDIDNNLELYVQSPLLGIPVSIKDLLFDIEDTVTTNGSLACILQKKDHDSLSVKRLKNGKAVFLGKTNVPEFGSGYITKNFLMKPTSNPWRLTHSAGGSSGGAAASVAGGLASIALANDSAGSIRLPSSFCSLFGYMPSCNRVPFTQQEELMFKPLHRIGPISHTVKDAALILDLICEQTELDPSHKPFTGFVDLLDQPFKPLKLGWSRDLGMGIQNDEIVTKIEKKLVELQKLGFEVEEIKLPFDLLKHLDDLKHFILAKFQNLGKKIPLIIKPILGSSISKLLDEAAEVTPEQYKQADLFRLELVKQMNELMKTYPLLITPTTASASFPIKEFPGCIEKIHSDPFVFFASLLFPFNFTGQPAASLPCGLNSEGLPFGLQVVGRENDDSVIFQFCNYFEKVFPWRQLNPSL